jgi:lipopolysaccharide export system protein LptA
MRYSFSLLFLPLLLMLLLSAFLCAPCEGADELTGKGPIVITSDKFSAEGKANIAVFEGNVVAKTGDMTLRSDRMTVKYSGDGRVEEIEAEGQVSLVKGDRVITSGKAVYVGEGRKIIFTGQPRAAEGENVVTGSRMTYMIDEDRSIVEDSKVFIKQKD